MIISHIAAVAQNRVIGKNNDLPWRLPDDMKFFMNTTKGHHVIMGRKNYESLHDKYRPLPNRTNIVVTRQKDYRAPGCYVVHSVEEGITLARHAREKELFIIGGAEIYQVSLAETNRLYLTEIHSTVSGDTYYPAVDFSQWKEISRTPHPADEKHAFAFDFVVYERL